MFAFLLIAAVVGLVHVLSLRPNRPIHPIHVVKPEGLVLLQRTLAFTATLVIVSIIALPIGWFFGAHFGVLIGGAIAIWFAAASAGDVSINW